MIIVFARAPVLGQAKTRLAPRLGEWRAARLQRQMIAGALASARAARCGAVELHGTRHHSFFSSFDVPFRLQRGDDLGERMYRALAKTRKPAILIGTDCPALAPAHIRRAMRWLRGGSEVVLVPAEDGGYALFGARRVRREFFEGIDWGSERVYRQTLARVQGFRWRALRTLWDVDRPEDLERVRALRLTSRFRRGALR